MTGINIYAAMRLSQEAQASLQIPTALIIGYDVSSQRPMAAAWTCAKVSACPSHPRGAEAGKGEVYLTRRVK